MQISLISSLSGAQLASYQIAVAAQLAQSNAYANAFSVAQLTDAAQQNFDPLANVAAGLRGEPRRQCVNCRRRRALCRDGRNSTKSKV